MPATNPRLNEARFELFLSHLLRAGVLLAAGVVLFGGILYLTRHGSERPDRKVFHGEPAELRDPVQIVRNAVHLSGRSTIQLGLLLLVATPVARVACSVVGFLRERDYLYTALTLVVLTVLLYSLFLGE
jgi:uncharacterized membrane protein